MAEQTKSLRNLFKAISENGKGVRYGDILRAGISSYVVEKLVKEFNAKLVNDNEGYTLIVIN
jgi:hypothetical protein